MANSDYPRGVEVVVGVFIFDTNGRVALANSPKWDVKLVPPGGHVEAGESIAEAAEREALEETGLRCDYIGVLNIGQMLTDQSKGFNRNAHFVFLHVLATTKDTELIPQKDEINTLQWLNPETNEIIDQLESVGQDSLAKAVAYMKGHGMLLDLKNM